MSLRSKSQALATAATWTVAPPRCVPPARPRGALPEQPGPGLSQASARAAVPSDGIPSPAFLRQGGLWSDASMRPPHAEQQPPHLPEVFTLLESTRAPTYAAISSVTARRPFQTGSSDGAWTRRRDVQAATRSSRTRALPTHRTRPGVRPRCRATGPTVPTQFFTCRRSASTLRLFHKRGPRAPCAQPSPRLRLALCEKALGPRPLLRPQHPAQHPPRGGTRRTSADHARRNPKPRVPAEPSGLHAAPQLQRKLGKGGRALRPKTPALKGHSAQSLPRSVEG